MSTPLIAVDIGNSRTKLGLFDGQVSSAELPVPHRTHSFDGGDWDETALGNWLSGVPADTQWWIASVNRPAAARLVSWLERTFSAGSGGRSLIRMLSHADMPIAVAL